MSALVVLIGAARSGTKLVRDVLAEHPEVEAFPYDMNYLWRLGLPTSASDEIEPPLHPKAKASILAGKTKLGGQVVIEKTVSNCLRIPAIVDAFPDAHFGLLLRDGFDVTESALRQWTAPTDWKYSARKALAFPWLKAPGYGLRHLRDQLLGGDRPTTWGPRYAGIERDIESKTLAEVCALQWARCTQTACDDFTRLGIAPQIVRYEDFVVDPVKVANRFHKSCGLAAVHKVDRVVSTSEVGKGRRSLSAGDVELISPIVEKASVHIAQWVESQHACDEKEDKS